MDRIVAAASRRPLTFRDDADQSMAQTSSSLAAGPARLAASARSSSRSGHPSPGPTDGPCASPVTWRP